MAWWNRFRQTLRSKAVPDGPSELDFQMEGWKEEEPAGNMRRFRGSNGGVLSLAVLDSNPWEDIRQLHHEARQLAESAGGGLIEAETLSCGGTWAVRLIYKRLQIPAYVFTGMFFAPLAHQYLVWTMVDGERETTGIREAVVTSRLYENGEFKSLQDYEHLWAKDPYDPEYQGVDRSVLRSLSDDDRYDAEFPDHPLSRVRAFQRNLCHWIASRQRTNSQSA